MMINFRGDTIDEVFFDPGTSQGIEMAAHKKRYTNRWCLKSGRAERSSRLSQLQKRETGE